MIALNGIYCFLFCFGSIQGAKPVPSPDTFCSVYRRQVLNHDDLTAINTLPRPIRNRMQANDLYYMCKCQKWGAPECRKVK